jgi:hypothetical protein
MSRITSVFVLLLTGIAVAACTAPVLDPPNTNAPPAFPGINADAPDHSVALRNLFVINPGPNGYPAGGGAPLAMQVWNNTGGAVSLTGATIKGGTAAVLVAGSQTKTTYDIPISAGNKVLLNQQAGQFLQVNCKGTLMAGMVVPMTFTFSNKAAISVDVPVGRFPQPSETTQSGCA